MSIGQGIQRGLLVRALLFIDYMHVLLMHEICSDLLVVVRWS